MWQNTSTLNILDWGGWLFVRHHVRNYPIVDDQPHPRQNICNGRVKCHISWLDLWVDLACRSLIGHFVLIFYCSLLWPWFLQWSNQCWFWWIYWFFRPWLWLVVLVLWWVPRWQLVYVLIFHQFSWVVVWGKLLFFLFHF